MVGKVIMAISIAVVAMLLFTRAYELGHELNGSTSDFKDSYNPWWHVSGDDCDAVKLSRNLDSTHHCVLMAIIDTMGYVHAYSSLFPMNDSTFKELKHKDSIFTKYDFTTYIDRGVYSLAEFLDVQAGKATGRYILSAVKKEKYGR